MFTEPFITDWVLDRIFREHANEVREKYIEKTWGNRYKMRPEYDTQRKVEAAFEGKETDKDIWIRDGLYALNQRCALCTRPQRPEQIPPTHQRTDGFHL